MVILGEIVTRVWERSDNASSIAAVLLEQDGRVAGWLNTRLVTDLLEARVDRWADRSRDGGHHADILYADDLAVLC